MVHEQWQRAPWRRCTGARQGVRRVRPRRTCCASWNTIPHVTQNLTRPGGGAIDGRTMRHEATRKAQFGRRRIEPAFGWLQTTAWIGKVKLRGLVNVDWLFVFVSAAFNLIRLPKLLPRAA